MDAVRRPKAGEEEAGEEETGEDGAGEEEAGEEEAGEEEADCDCIECHLFYSILSIGQFVTHARTGSCGCGLSTHAIHSSHVWRRHLILGAEAIRRHNVSTID